MNVTVNILANIPEEEEDEFNNNLEHSDFRARYTASGNVSGYEIQLRHFGLNEYKVVSSKEIDVLEKKVQNQIEKWHDKWMKQKRKNDKIQLIQDKEDLAQKRTIEAKEVLQTIDNILIHTLSINDAIDWSVLKDKSNFSMKHESIPKFIKINKFGKPTTFSKKEPPNAPLKENFAPAISFFDSIFGKKKKKEEEAEKNFQNAITSFDEEVASTTKENEERKLTLENITTDWSLEKNKFDQKKEEYNTKIDSFQELYRNLDAESIKEYCSMVLENSEYPDFISKNYVFDYLPEPKTFVIDYALPSPDNFPKLSEVKYNKINDEFKESYTSDKQLEKMYDTTIYKMTLRTIHEIFEADVVSAIDAIAFNGIVTAVDKSTGQDVTSCILSIHTTKEEFLEIDLGRIDPKECFRRLKGVGSSKLHSITPVCPIMQLDKEDKRFTEHYNIADSLSSHTNLAAMDWKDFENIIRELFESEFKSSGGEVRVTQASRDGGVDAIAFDPDPIRGGKIIIQAKRYTNTVDVSAVRDLYGTVVNEGATKGILVTTSDYGPDAYKFSKDKPLVLMNGANLLYLFEKHGKKFKIDVKEAKSILKDLEK